MKVRQDAKGLYIVNARGSGHYRPGEVPSYAHAYDMSAGGLKEGDNPKATHVVGAPLLRIRTDDGRVLYWADEYTREKYAHLAKL